MADSLARWVKCRVHYDDLFYFSLYRKQAGCKRKCLPNFIAQICCDTDIAHWQAHKKAPQFWSAFLWQLKLLSTA